MVCPASRHGSRLMSRYLLLTLSVVGIVFFSQGLRTVDTVGTLASGAIAGAALASIAAARRGARRT